MRGCCYQPYYAGFLGLEDFGRHLLYVNRTLRPRTGFGPGIVGCWIILGGISAAVGTDLVGDTKKQEPQASRLGPARDDSRFRGGPYALPLLCRQSYSLCDGGDSNVPLRPR